MNEEIIREVFNSEKLQDIPIMHIVKVLSEVARLEMEYGSVEKQF